MSSANNQPVRGFQVVIQLDADTLWLASKTAGLLNQPVEEFVADAIRATAAMLSDADEGAERGSSAIGESRRTSDGDQP